MGHNGIADWERIHECNILLGTSLKDLMGPLDNEGMNENSFSYRLVFNL